MTKLITSLKCILKHIPFRLLILSFINTSAFSAWKHTAGPEGGDIREIIIRNDTILIGTWGGGICRSIDHSATWAILNDGITDRRINTVAFKGKLLVAGTTRGHIYLSSDGGIQWKKVHQIYVYDTFMSACVADNVILFGTEKRLYRSMDNGKTWIDNDSVFFDNGPRALLTDENIIIAGTKNGIYRSINNGITWEKVFNENTNALVSNNTTLFAGGEQGWISLSTDHGLTWGQCTQIQPYKLIKSLAADDHFLFAGFNTDGLYRFNLDSLCTESRHYTKVSLITGETFDAIATEGSIVYAGTQDNGIYQSSDSGKTWKSYSTGFPFSKVHDFIVSGDTLYAGTFGSGVFFSPDQGDSWIPLNDGLTNTHILSMTSIEGEIIAGTIPGQIEKYSFDSSKWIQLYKNDNIYVSTLTSIGKTCYAGTSSGIYRSTVGSPEWTLLNFGLSTQNDTRKLYVADHYLFAGIYYNGVLHSSDSGSHWINMNDNDTISKTLVNSITSNSKYIFAGTGSNGLFRTGKTYNKLRWEPVNKGLTDSCISSLHSIGETIFAGTNSQGIFRSFDDGNTWDPINSGLDENFILSIKSNNQTLFIGTNGSGIWRCPLSEVISSSSFKNVKFQHVNTPHILKISLLPPGRLCITFLSAPPKHFNLVLYSLSGKQLSMQSGFCTNPKNPVIYLEIPNLESGCFILRINFDTKTITEYISLVK